MRQVYLDTEEDNEIKKVSFYSVNEGYVAFSNWIGYTTDSGRTFTKKYITLGNVDYGSYSVNLTFGFYINGIKAFNRNIILAYGHYGLVPAILYSSNGGNSYTLIYHSQYKPLELKTGITDMIFPQGGNTGYAVDADRILKTTNGGLTWSINSINESSFFTYLEAVDDNNVFAIGTEYTSNKSLKTTNGGLSWSNVTLPALQNGKINYLHFLNSSTGWLSMYGDNNIYNIYKTIDGGTSWILMNDPVATPFGGIKLKFFDVNTGYCLSGQNTVYKTTNSGATWEPLPRNNNYNYLGYSHNDLFFLNNNQLWAGGGHGFLELSTNGGGVSLPRAYFRTDTTGMYATNNVNLLNYSKAGYTYKWMLNGVQLSNVFNASYTHNAFHLTDTVSLIVSNGTASDTLIKYLYFAPPVIITSFTPASAGKGTTVDIKGKNFLGASAVSFGNTMAAYFYIMSDTAIRATVGNGSSGDIKVVKENALGQISGFTFVYPPTINSFDPDTAAAGTPVIITGTNFTGTTSVSFGNVQASYRVINATTISATAPSGNAGDVKVITPGGTATLPGFVALPTVSSFTPLQGTMGTIMTIDGTSFTNAIAVTVGGVNVTSFTVNSANKITAVVGTGASGNVTVSLASGSSSKTGFAWFPPPVINSFSPLAGPVGTTVTISGSGFNNTPAGNIVLFGSVKATVTSASSTSLTVTVPTGAIYEPITVIANNLIGVSKTPFIVSFANGGSITASSFANRDSVLLGSAIHAGDIWTRDVDKDGKNDIILLQSNSSNALLNGMLILRNTSTGTTPTFATPLLITASYEGMEIGDLDGDGREDLIVSADGLHLYRNLSTPGNILFDTAVKISTGNYWPEWFCITDVDGDGKKDIFTRLWASSSTLLYKNISEPGKFAFKTAINIGDLKPERNVIASDLTGDGKPEIIFSGGQILPNNSTPDKVSFGAVVTMPEYLHSFVASGDIDGDGKNDLVFGDRYQSKIHVLKNTGTGGNISFAASIDLASTADPAGVYISDMDGDGKPDIITVLSNYQTAVFKNTSTGGNISFAAKMNYNSGTFYSDYILAVADMNNDGKNDIVVSSGNFVNIFKNEVKKDPFILSFDPQIGEAGTVVTIKGNNFTGTTSVRFGSTPAASFVVNNDNTITATVGAGTTSGDVTVVSNIGTATLAAFAYGFAPVINSLSVIKGLVNSTVTINGNHFNSDASNNTVYFGTVKAKIVTASATAITVLVPFGSEGKNVSVTSNGLTAFSANNFITNFTTAQNAFTSNSFGVGAEVPGINTANFADLDGDGKIDIITPSERYGGETTSKWLNVARNVSTTGYIKYAPAAKFPFNGLGKVATGDLDGDGKLDVVAGYSNMLSVYKNNSTPGIIALDPKIDFTTNSYIDNVGPSEVVIKDLNADGKPDVAVALYQPATIGVLKNSSSKGNLLLNDRTDYRTNSGGYFTTLFLEDIDGDKKPEMIATTTNRDVSFSIFQNTSTIASISFASSIEIGSSKGGIQVGDIDLDGKNDIVFCKNDTLSVYRNTSTPGNISFAPKIDLFTGTSSLYYYLSINDLDGDGRPEIIGSNYDSTSLSVFKNNSTPGNISLAPKITYPVSINPWLIMCYDADNDGKADIFSFNGWSTPKLQILRNLYGTSNISIASFTPVSALQGTPVTINGNGFNNVTTITFGNVPADSFIIHSDNLITAYPGNGSSGSVIVSNSDGMASLEGFSYSSKPALASISPSAAATGATVNITGANLSAVSSVIFNDKPAQSFKINSSTSIAAVIAPGSVSGTVKVMSGSDTATLPVFVIKDAPEIYSFSPTEGSAVTTVKILGKNFTNAIAVDFAGKEAQSFTVVRDDSLVATVGEVNTGNITVSTDAGNGSLGTYTNINIGRLKSFYPTVATKGTEVLITGTNMGAITAVSFGNTPAASFSVTSSSSIIAIVDTGSSGNVTVSMGPGRNSSLAGFTYVPPTVPGIASFTPARAAVGTTIYINGVNFANVTAVNIGGVAASSFTVVSPQVIKAVVANAASGNVSVTAAAGNATKEGFVFTTAPYISSFYPAAAMPGRKVSIYGSNFSSVVASNTVYFGSVKATVVSASANKIVVAVPKQALYGKLSVTANNLTAYSNQSFIPLFASTGQLNSNSFIARVDSAIMINPVGVTIADIDVDGKADICVSGTKISFIKNLSVNGNLLLSPPVAVNSTISSFMNICADYNGDGLLDMSSTNNADANGIYVAKNTSTPGNISLAAGLQLNPGLTNSSIASSDIDGDGKPEIIGCSYYNGPSVFRNTSTVSTISFDAAKYFGVPQSSNTVTIQDVDGDYRPDIIFYSNAGMNILRNTSTAGVISFEAVSTLWVSGYCSGYTMADINADGYPEIVAISRDTKQLIIFENNCRPGFIYFKPFKNLYTGTNTNMPVVQDIDGDGKLDIISASSQVNTINLYRNSSGNAGINYDQPIPLTSLVIPGKPIIADIDGDDKPEIIVSHTDVNTISFFKNNIGVMPASSGTCPGGSASFTSNISGAGYQWQVNTGNGFVNINNSVNYSGTQNTTLQLNNLPSSWYGYVYRCRSGNKMSQEFSLKFTNNWTGAINSLWSNPGNWSCNVVPDGNTDVVIDSGTVTLNVNGTCRTLFVNPSVSFIVTSGVQLTITH